MKNFVQTLGLLAVLIRRRAHRARQALRAAQVRDRAFTRLRRRPGHQVGCPPLLHLPLPLLEPAPPVTVTAPPLPPVVETTTATPVVPPPPGPPPLPPVVTMAPSLPITSFTVGPDGQSTPVVYTDGTDGVPTPTTETIVAYTTGPDGLVTPVPANDNNNGGTIFVSGGRRLQPFRFFW
ncbi:hypothetical protein SPI_06085 [Niveomyces insectorum RCEF 264]|uniref:Uncharacterized protein n=1 Tax=Niveomyces insectorum RCEF 264 TaxID=1081102 RepID=A0A167SSD1_9HYPO|nr:hypothetical protein SPI_06085 [Niveomyces insectorum RCEF 264]